MLLEKISKRKKALEQYEKDKRKKAEKAADANYENLEMTKRCQEKRREDSIALARQLRNKET